VETQELPPVADQLKDNQIGTKDLEGQKKVIDVLPDNPSQIEEGPVLFTDEKPIFPGGDPGLFKYLETQIKYPIRASEAHIEGIVYISFVVDKEGRIKDAKVLHGIGWGCDEEALRVIKSMPVWKPGKTNGKALSVLFNIPVHFKIN
jgi:protein TonB